MTDAQLLEAYRLTQSQPAFAELVRRHVDWVHSVARRRVHDSNLADDVTQAVFVLLARKTPRLQPGRPLSAWLFPVANFACKQVLRTAHRRKLRETEAAKMREDSTETDEASIHWSDIAALLDDLVGSLASQDRQAVLLRFYEQKSFPEIGHALQISEEAARKRVSRAIEKLRHLFHRKGVTVGAAALTASLSTQLIQPASAAAITASTSAVAVKAASPLVKGASVMLAWASIKPLPLVASIVMVATLTATVLQINRPMAQAQPEQPAPATAPATAPAARYGRVIDEDDKPVAGARIWYSVWSKQAEQYRMLATATADVDGRFQISRIDETARLLMKAPGFAWSGGQLLSTVADDPDEVRMLPATTVRLRIIDVANKPVPGLIVRARWAAGPILRDGPSFEGIDEPEFAQTTNEDGRCTFADMPRSGQATFQVLDERFAELGDSSETTLRDSDVTDAVIQLKPAASISGKVTYQDSGKPAQGVKVAARNELGSATALTDAQGIYHLKMLTAGRNVVILQLSEEINRQYAAMAVNALQTLPGSHLENIDFSLVTGGVIRGRVAEPGTGKPVAGMMVGITGPSNPESGHMSQTAVSDATGSFVVHVPAGASHLEAFAPPFGYRSAKPQSYDVKVVDGQTIDLNFEAARSGALPLTGKAVDPQGRPLGGARIFVDPSVYRPPGEQVTVTDAAGAFSIPLVTPGSMIRARKGQWSTLEPVVAGGASLTLVLHDNSQASATMVIRQVDGSPVAGARIQLRDSAGNETYVQKRSGVDGTCAFTRMYPDISYKVTIAAPGFGIMNAPVPVQRGREIELAPIIMRKADSFVAGMVLDEAGDPVPDTVVEIITRSFGIRARTDANGHFRLGGLVAGERLLIQVETEDRSLKGSVGTATAGMDSVIVTLRPIEKAPSTLPAR